MISAALEASARPGSVALAVGAQRFQLELSAEAAHASDLLAALESLCARHQVAPPALELVVVGLGPGSFTGLRVAIASALGLARGARARCAGLSAPEALGFARLAPGTGASWITELRKGEYALAQLARSADDCLLQGALRCLCPRELPQALTGCTRLLAPGLGAGSALLELLPPGVELETRAGPQARELLELALARDRSGRLACSEELEPLYLTPFRAAPRAR